MEMEEELNPVHRTIRNALLSILLVFSLVGVVTDVAQNSMETGGAGFAPDLSKSAESVSEPDETNTWVTKYPDSSAAGLTTKSTTARGLSDAGNIAWLLAEGPTLPSRTVNPESEPGFEPGYFDPLIDPGVSADPPLSALSAQRAARLPGFANAEYRLFTQNTSDSFNYRYREHGVATQLQQETTAYGRFDFIAALTNGDGDNLLPNSFTGGHYINMAQRDFALTSHLQMDNELGDIRARVPTLLSQGYFIRLPEPLIEGLSSEIRSTDASLRVTSGTLGTYQGRTFPVFTSEYSNGSATSLSGQYRISPQWQASLQIWDANNVLTATGTDSFTSLAGTLRYDRPETGKAQMSVLHSSNGATGFWLDGEKRFAGWQNNLGLYRMDPNLQWVDRNTTVLTDTQGIYARTATRDQNSYSSLGLDWAQTNVDSNPLLSTRTSAILFGNYNYQLTDSTSVNGYLGLGDSRASGAGVDLHDTSVTVRGSTSTRFSTGTSAWLLGDDMRNGSNAYNRLDASWDYFWNTTAGFSGLRSGLSYAQQTGSVNDFRQASVRAGGNYSLNNSNVGASFTYGYLDSETIDSNRAMSVVLSAGWRFAANWRLNADLTYNDNALTLSSVNTELRISDTQLLVSLRYDSNWGRSIIPIGKVNGAYGYGAVRGVLFLDQNGNGVRDPSEPGVPNVTVMLDRGYTTETNSNGEFSFTPVPSGTHQLYVNVANVPLPWNLSQERAFDVTVNAREQSTLDIPLVSMRPN
jgi:SdrD B-like domain